MNSNNVVESTSYLDKNVLFLNLTFDSALIVSSTFKGYLNTVYNSKKIISILMHANNLDYLSASEYYDFNISSAYVCNYTPIFADKFHS